MSDEPKDEAVTPPTITYTAPLPEPEPESEPEAKDDESFALWEAQDQTKQLPARFATRLYVTPEGQHIRIAFGERIDDETVYHTALVLPAGEALQMAQLLARIAGASVDQQIEMNRYHLAALKSLRGMDPTDG